MSNTEITVKAKKYRELHSFIKELEAEAEALKHDMIQEMSARGVDRIEADIFTIKYTTFRASRIDTTALKAALPDVAARFTNSTMSSRFQVA